MNPPSPSFCIKGVTADYDLTVITVCRNVLPELKRTVDSVQTQKKVAKGLSIEHLIVDGASTDGTPDWLKDMQAQGKIEAYVSEPDSGIYDAMNKGINMARGTVLFFLNADDVFTENVDLEACVSPIAEGIAPVVAAAVDCGGKLTIPCKESLFIGTFCCHQGYFAAASLYRALGGFDASAFRCFADADFMNRAALRCSEMILLKDTVVLMAPDGFSGNCSWRFMHEMMELMYRYREPILQRAATDASYREVIISHIFTLCIRLRDWQTRYETDIRTELQHFAALCEEYALQTPLRAIRRAMLFTARSYVPHVLTHRRISRLMWLRLRLHMKVLQSSQGALWRDTAEGSVCSLTKTAAAYVLHLRNALFH